MSQIQSNVGLITGIPIQETVDQLMALAARPRDTLSNRTKALGAERTALDQLGGLLLGFRFSATSMSSASLYSATKATSNNTSLLTVTAKTSPPPQAGTYSFTPLQKATTHQAVSSSFSDVASQLSTGTFRIGVGGQVDRGVKLTELNSGQGVPPGKIRITDRSGASAEIDLRTALSIDDVLDAINSSVDVDVTATVEGDSIKLTDNSGGTGNLRVKEVGLGTTAAALGLASVNVAGNVATGTDIYSLHSGTLLKSLNDGAGVQIHSVGDVLSITTADATELTVNVSGKKTLGEVVALINAADNTRLTAAISADGRRLELRDLTTGSGTFEVTSTGTIADDLGISGDAVGGVITGRRLASGLRDTLLSSLNGGAGVGELTSLNITDRAGGAPVNVDLSSAETLSDVVDLINDSAANVTAAINSSRNGIVIEDTSGGTGNLIIASSDNTAASLGIEIDDQVASINSGSLNRQVISHSTLLADFNGGKGVKLGDFRITDSSGAQSAVSLNDVGSEAETIGDVLDKINSLSIGVEARINDSGDGILITDTAGGTGKLTIAEIGGGRAAKDLRILAESSATNEGGQQVIDGRTSFEVDLSTLELPDSVALSTLNNGNGISLGTFRVTAANGESFAVVLNKPGQEAFSVDDVIDKINAAATEKGINVTASLNTAGTGIRILDTTVGNGTLKVEDLGSGTAAAQLLLTTASTKSLVGTQSIDGRGLFAAQDQNQDALGVLVQAINDFGGGFTASTFFDGSGYRLSITSKETGAAQELTIDTSDANFSIAEATRPRDAVLQFGNSSAGGIVVSAAKNQFDNVVPGLTINVAKASNDSVTVDVTQDTSKLTTAATSFVDSFNSLRTTIQQLTSFDAEAQTTGLLFGRNEVLRIETDLARILSGRFTSSPSVRSLEGLGISLNDEGKLELDTAQFNEAITNSPGEVERFFNVDGVGVVDQLTKAIDQLAGEETSLIARRYDALTSTIDANNARIETMNKSLERERERTLLEFYRLEETIAKLQGNTGSLEAIQYIPPIGRSN
ncbi:flagellar filament capping protein FliD [Aeoliella sp. SH292]|uniref:flagellar filament capping protein FliD n=1 Tax=Aeoliella sp. SH292 TaxID=3454464 RepID=UPI003F9833DF